MAAIQVTAIGAEWKLIQDSQPTGWLAVSVVSAFLFLGLALYFSAWTMSAVPSLNLRLGRLSGEAKPTDDFDVYCWPSFTWWGARNVTLGRLMGLQHWCWGLGLLFVGLTALLMRWLPGRQ
jgi:hypothetical protein